MTEAPHHRTRHHRLTREDHDLLGALRDHRHQARRAPRARTIGERVADAVAAVVGSWRFIIIQSALLFLWLTANAIGWFWAWDPYPFILLNLVLSFQAAYTAPIIMMSQNRQADQDREMAAEDYRINTKAELEIELLHEKIDLMREQEIATLTAMIDRLEAKLLAAKP